MHRVTKCVFAVALAVGALTGGVGCNEKTNRAIFGEYANGVKQILKSDVPVVVLRH